MKSAERLPPPSRPDASVGDLVTELGERVGGETAARWCADLLSGADPHDHVAMLGYLGPNCASAAFDPRWHDYWVRTWGARGLLYVWTDSAASAVIRGLEDMDWRPAEMCLKVSSLRELADAGDPAVRLTDHELPRVRANAVRTLGLVGDTEHVQAVQSALDDGDSLVRRAADLAMRRISARLDIVYVGGM